MKQLLDYLCQVEGMVIDIGSARISIYRMSDELREECLEILNCITSGSIRNDAQESILRETMESYILGEKELDECYSAFLNQMLVS